jgi:hypothetical protein
MTALVLLEAAMRPERFKPYWRLWAYPAPNPAMAGAQGTLAMHVWRQNC